VQRVIAALLALARNAVPAFGVFVRDWAAANALLLYLGENVVMALLAALTVRLLAPASEAIEGKEKSRGESLRTFFLIAVPFTCGAAVFALVVVLIREEYSIRPHELASGLALMVLFQLIAFATGLRRLRGTTLAEFENMLVSVLGRVFLLAFAVWAGLFLVFFFSTAFVIPFMVLKTIADLGELNPTALKRRLMPGRQL
jgi:hypothetical protein